MKKKMSKKNQLLNLKTTKAGILLRSFKEKLDLELAQSGKGNCHKNLKPISRLFL